MRCATIDNLTVSLFSEYVSRKVYATSELYMSHQGAWILHLVDTSVIIGKRIALRLVVYMYKECKLKSNTILFTNRIISYRAFCGVYKICFGIPVFVYRHKRYYRMIIDFPKKTKQIDSDRQCLQYHVNLLVSQ